MTAVIAVLLILVGLPLLAWWLGSRRAWSRIDARARDSVTVEREWIARHALSAFEQAEVDRAVTWGRALTDPRLRAAAVDRARTIQATMHAWNEQLARWFAIVRWRAIELNSKDAS